MPVNYRTFIDSFHAKNLNHLFMKHSSNTSVTSIVVAMAILPFCAFAQTDHKEKIIAAWERAKVYTQEYLEAATQEVYDFKPTPEIRSFAEQMQHLAVTIINWCVRPLRQ